MKIILWEFRMTILFYFIKKLKYAWSLNLVLKPMKNMSSLQLRDTT